MIEEEETTMRLRVLLDNPQETWVPINSQEQLTAAVYGLLASSDVDYATFLHDAGYQVDGGPKTFKFFTFSGLRVPKNQRRIDGAAGRLWLAPGWVEWLVSSPVEAFLTHCATGLLAIGSLRVGGANFPITQVEALPAPTFTETMRFTCLSPLVAARPLPGGGTYYLRPTEGEAFSDAIRANLLRKHRLLHGQVPADDRWAMTFDPTYLSRTSGGTKLVTFKGIGIVGAFCPFTVSGSPELMETGYQTGLGEKNAGGFGMVDVVDVL
jgi:CRISPR-associated endoribonuclease Cas6